MKQEKLKLSDIVGVMTKKTEEDEIFEQTDTLDQTECPLGICDGSGFIPFKDDPRKSESCECRNIEIIKQKLKNARMNEDLYDKNFDSYDSETKVFLLKPRKQPVDFKPNTRMKTLLDEPSEKFTKRNYNIVEEKRTVQELLKSYCEKNITLLNEHKKTANLMLFGDPGNGKTTFATLTGLEFIKKGKSVYFSTTQDFLDHIFNKTINPKEIARTYDVLILDELFNEYHTDNQFAKKTLKEIFKIREEAKKITICTSNANPKGFSLLYGESIMSLINGTFFLFNLSREIDGRVQNIHDMYDDFEL